MNQSQLLNALSTAAKAVAVDKLILTDDFNGPIYPEALVQVAAAMSLKKQLPHLALKLEYSTRTLEEELRGTKAECDLCLKPGRVDIAIWSSSKPIAVIEVKDQLANSDDGLVKDVERIQKLLDIEHRKIGTNLLEFGGAIAYVGKSCKQYKEYKYFDQDLENYSERSVETVKQRMRDTIDCTKYKIIFQHGRCIDSSKDSKNTDLQKGTEFEETISGEEHMTKYVVAVITNLSANQRSVN